MKKYLLAATFGLGLFAAPVSAYALEGDWEVGGDVTSVFMLEPLSFGVGGDIFARYNFYDGFSLSTGVGAYYMNSEHDVDSNRKLGSFGLYTLRVGIYYALDIINWVPSAGIHLNHYFSENKDWKWHRSGNGFGLDAEIHLQYRGIRHLGLGVFFSYHLMFTSPDYMTLGLSCSWFSGEF